MMLSEIVRSMTGARGDCRVTVSEDWLQGRTLFGGLQAALAVRAMRSLVPEHVPLRTLQVIFVAPVPAGEVRIAAQLLRAGKSAQHAEARIFDAGQLACVAIGVFGTARESAIRITPPARRPEVPAERAQALPYAPGITPAFTQHVQMRWAAGGLLFSGAAEARTETYLALRGEPAIDEYGVIGLSDIIPSPGLSLLRKPAMASSMTWALDFLRDDYDARPDPLWWMDAQVTSGRDGYLSQTGTLYSGAGEAVAYSRQSVVVFG